MKKTLLLSIILLSTSLSSCGVQQNINSYTTVKPYNLSEKETALLHLLPLQQGHVSFYEVTIPHKQAEIFTNIEYYQNGEKVKDMGGFSSSDFKDKKIRLAVGQQMFQHTNNETWQWFMGIDDSSMTVSENSLPNINGSAFEEISSSKKIEYNKRTVLAAWIKTNKNHISSLSIEDESSRQRLIQENEHVYLFIIEIKRGDASQ
ncbi:hypothetical protein CON94_10710 [Bacillus pseudomycoides]|uniref:hypothetical protein n=1 Tax=Bacillus pseudomycoides TaxID=64104 RepID=UPI000BEB3730|nr:hypothetical protein [Bacillus pseudomycoides]PEF75282.1 hypothetical protein CON94_10710 [Bacillus pseudomycoides]PEL81740.1 hypothetical protein CN615_22725 [Bacillus pseudomycoides]PHB20159.1 hypothetical protein COE80_23760 [Bacillus pseudomycoides]